MCVTPHTELRMIQLGAHSGHLRPKPQTLAFEPNTLALGIFVGHKLCATCLALNRQWPKPRHMGRCLRRNRRTLLDTLADELAEPVMYYLNHLPPSTWVLAMLVVFVILL